MRFTLEEIFPDGSPRRTDIAKARIFLSIRDGAGTSAQTRSSLASQLALRPATVSAMVAELLQDGLVIEGEKGPALGKGRPEIPLQARPERLLVAVIDIVAREVRGVLVDMNGRTVHETTIIVDVEQTDSEALTDAFQSVIDELLQTERPSDALIPGIGIALPGIVDERGLRWISAARWPRLSGLDFHRIAERTGLPVRIERKRQAELRARFQSHPEERSGGVLFVNWGYGISSAYAHNGTVLASAIGGFGDLGHWLVDGRAGAKCLCGQTGCLEAHAALWALLPALRRVFPDTPSKPESLSEFMRTHDLVGLPEVQRAIELFATSLHNLFKTFFPDRIVLTGNVLRNDLIVQKVWEQFFKLAPAYAHDRVELTLAGPDTDAVIGIASPFFQESLRPLLVARNARV